MRLVKTTMMVSTAKKMMLSFVVVWCVEGMVAPSPACLLKWYGSEPGALRSALENDEEAIAFFEKYDVASLPGSETSFVKTSAEKGPAVVLLHGFDSSALEFRRLLPLLEQRGVRAYAIDILGWGFTRSKDGDVGVVAKRKQISEFLSFIDSPDVLLVGASLGGATAVDYYKHLKDKKDLRLGLVAPQVTIDGAPKLSPFFAQFGVKVLKSYPLRWIANQLAYADTKTFATSKAIAVGQIHTRRQDWDQMQMAWLGSGGYTTISSDFKAVCDDIAAAAAAAQTTTLDIDSRPKDKNKITFFWGKQDNILPPFPDTVDLLKSVAPEANFLFYDDCGHVPHLEKPDSFAKDLADLL